MTTKLNFKQSMSAGVKAAVAALVINGILFYVFRYAGVISDDILIDGKQPLSIIPIIISCILPSLMAALVFFLVEKFTNNGYIIFSVVALVLLVLSFLSPFLNIKGISVGYGITLNLMHVVVALSVLYFIKRELKVVKQTAI
jgi:drug/metabolite transporter (DMT)-like permease